ncbi:MAG: hypothetical protein ACRCUT_08515 [Spirochaetota bacterium]
MIKKSLVMIFGAFFAASMIGCGSDGSSSDSQSGVWKVEKKISASASVRSAETETESEYEEEDGWFVSFDGLAAVLQKKTAGSMITVGFGKVDGEQGKLVLSADTVSGVLGSFTAGNPDYVNLKTTFAEFSELQSLAAGWNNKTVIQKAEDKDATLSQLNVIMAKFAAKEDIIAEIQDECDIESKRAASGGFWTKVKDFLATPEADEMDLEDAAQLFDYYDPSAARVNSTESSNVWLNSTNVRLNAVQWGIYDFMYDSINSYGNIDLSDASLLGKVLNLVLTEENEIDELDEINTTGSAKGVGGICPWVDGTYENNGDGVIEGQYYRFVKIADDIDEAI